MDGTAEVLRGLDVPADVTVHPRAEVGEYYDGLGAAERRSRVDAWRERHAVALLWVQQTSAAVRRIMRRHLEASRTSQDLEFAVEVRVFLQYAQLRVICGGLFLLVGLAGPQRLRGMALYAHRLTQRIGGVLREFESGARAREISGAGPY